MITVEKIKELFHELWPIHRTIVSAEFDESLKIIEKYWNNPWTDFHFVASGTRLQCGWIVPQGWKCRDAFIKNQSGDRILSYSDTNLRVMSHSRKVDFFDLPWEDLQKHLYTSKARPSAIPYITSYYSDSDWAFCLSETELENLKGSYDGGRVFIDSEHFPFHLTIAERHFGNRDNYIIVATYLCHPSMANNELSGPLVFAELVRLFETHNPDLSKTGIKFIIWPETIGAIAYMDLLNHKSPPHKPQPVITLTCLGLSRDRYEILGGKNSSWNQQIYKRLGTNDDDLIPWTKRGSDERQFNFPNSKYFSCTISRGIFGSYPEYHTSEDNLSLIDFDYLLKVSRDLYALLLEATTISRPYYPHSHEPFLSSYGLYPKISKGANRSLGKDLCEIFFYCDGLKTVEEITAEVPHFSEKYVLQLIELGYEMELLL